MATVQPTFVKQRDENNVLIVKWVLANGDVGAPVSKPEYADRSVQVFGTFGTGGTLILQGSNEGDDSQSAPTTYATLTDQGGTNLSFTGAGLKQVLQNTNWVRPNCSAGDGTTSLTVYMVFRKR